MVPDLVTNPGVDPVLHNPSPGSPAGSRVHRTLSGPNSDHLRQPQPRPVMRWLVDEPMSVVVYGSAGRWTLRRY